MAFRRRAKSHPLFSQEFLIHNHADIGFCLVLSVLIALMFEVSPLRRRPPPGRAVRVSAPMGEVTPLAVPPQLGAVPSRTRCPHPSRAGGCGVRDPSVWARRAAPFIAHRSPTAGGAPRIPGGPSLVLALGLAHPCAPLRLCRGSLAGEGAQRVSESLSQAPAPNPPQLPGCPER